MDPYIQFRKDLRSASIGYEHTHRKALKMHAAGGAEPVHDELVPALFLALASELWAPRHHPKPRKPSNWRWRIEADLDRRKFDETLDPEERGEVQLERDLVRATGLADWTFQMSTMSGVFSKTGHGRRAIDLVYRVAPGHLEFIELKTISNNPLYAAFEILRYGLTWCHARRAGMPDPDHVLDAHQIDLIVLAPRGFYGTALGVANTFLDAFTASINKGLATVAADIPGLTSMTLAFRSFGSQQALIEAAKHGAVGEQLGQAHLR